MIIQVKGTVLYNNPILHILTYLVFLICFFIIVNKLKFNILLIAIDLDRFKKL